MSDYEQENLDRKKREDQRQEVIKSMSSKLPKFISSKLIEKPNSCTQFGSELFFNPNQYVRYTFADGTHYMSTTVGTVKQIPIYNGSSAMTFYNPMDDVEVEYNHDHYISIGSYYDLDYIIRFNIDCGCDVITIGYTEWSGWLVVDLEKYLRARLEKHVIIDDAIGLYKIKVGNNYYKLGCLYDFKNNQDICNEKTWIFNSYESARNFIYYIDKELKNLVLVDTFEDMYEDIKSGKLSKSDFLNKVSKV